MTAALPHDPPPLTVASSQEPVEVEASPEQLLISALLDYGDYTPGRFGVPDDAIRAFRQVHEFCLKYQMNADEAPPVHLVMEKFPSYRHIPDISPAWAAQEVVAAKTNRDLRKLLGKAASAIQDRAHGEAITIMRDGVREISVATTPGIEIDDFDALEEEKATAYCPIPPGYLSRLTGGHPAKKLWMTAALWSVGKSWSLLEHAVAAAEGGWDVKVISTEMTPGDMMGRLHTIALREWAQPSAFMNEEQRQAAIREWKGESGRITMWGPGKGRVDATTISGVVEHEKTLVLVDFINKLYTTDGHRAGEDWSIIAQISNELQEKAQELNIPLHVAAQLNRQGDLAGSVVLEQDADLIITKERLSKTCNSVRKNTVHKTRHTGGQGTSWFTRFDPGNGRFGDITSEEALAMRLEEEAAAAPF